jgi:hypothetical protein
MTVDDKTSFPLWIEYNQHCVNRITGRLEGKVEEEVGGGRITARGTCRGYPSTEILSVVSGYHQAS